LRNQGERKRKVAWQSSTQWFFTRKQGCFQKKLVGRQKSNLTIKWSGNNRRGKQTGETILKLQKRRILWDWGVRFPSDEHKVFHKEDKKKGSRIVHHAVKGRELGEWGRSKTVFPSDYKRTSG